jgi:uncharacterized membrane protein
MGKEEFLRQLEALLYDISAEERADAMAFYRSYFEDAGPENESAILKELESPQKVAESIRKNLETGVSVYHGSDTGKSKGYGKQGQAGKDNTAAIILGVILLVFTIPLWMGAAITIFGILIAIVAVTAAFLIMGFVLAGTGIGEFIAAQPLIGIGLLGCGCIVLAVGILFLLLTVWLFGVCIPWLWRGIVTLCKKMFGRGEERAAV